MYLYKNNDEYIAAQLSKAKNLVEIHFRKQWIKGKTIKAICNYLKEHIAKEDLKFGICHGVSHGYEVKKFEELLKIKVIGTELYPNKDPRIIEWDFHQTKPEWIKGVDFMYSNAFDHSPRPQKCLEAWMSCLSDNGICFIEWTDFDNRTCNIIDCFQASREEYRDLMQKYLIEEIEFHDRRKTVLFVLKANK